MLDGHTLTMLNVKSANQAQMFESANLTFLHEGRIMAAIVSLVWAEYMSVYRKMGRNIAAELPFFQEAICIMHAFAGENR